jgi:hypothetical protein
MTEDDRVALLKNAIHYWLASGWYHKGSRYDRVGNIDSMGDLDTGGVDIYVSKDGAAPVTISFTNTECYGGDENSPTLTPFSVSQRVYTETGV